MPWNQNNGEIATMKLGLSPQSKLLIRHDKYLTNLVKEMLICSYEHTNCSLCPVFIECRAWFDQTVAFGINNGIYLMQEPHYYKAIKEFNEIKNGVRQLCLQNLS